MLGLRTTHHRQSTGILRIAAFWVTVLALLIFVPARGAVFVFGDSISDTGNACLLPFVGALQPADPVSILDDLIGECRDARYFLGRTTHGPVWAEVLVSGLNDTPLLGTPLHALVDDPTVIPFFPDEMSIGGAPPAVAALLGLAPPALFADGANFAVSGAETVDLLGPDENLDPLASEVGAFVFLLMDPGRGVEAGPADDYVIWIGANDVRRRIRDEEPVQVEQGIARIVATIGTLQQAAGAQHFLVANLPDVGLSADFTAEQRTLATRATHRWNRALDAALDTLDDPDVTRLDAFCLTDALIDFARLDTELTCLDSDRYPGCEGLLLFDDIHATAPVHRGFARGAQAALACRDVAAYPGSLRQCVARFTRNLVRQGLWIARPGARSTTASAALVSTKPLP